MSMRSSNEGIVPLSPTSTQHKTSTDKDVFIANPLHGDVIAPSRTKLSDANSVPVRGSSADRDKIQRQVSLPLTGQTVARGNITTMHSYSHLENMKLATHKLGASYDERAGSGMTNYWATDIKSPKTRVGRFICCVKVRQWKSSDIKLTTFFYT